MQLENRFPAIAKATTGATDVMQAAAVMAGRKTGDVRWQVESIPCGTATHSLSETQAEDPSTHKPLRFVCSGFFV